MKVLLPRIVSIRRPRDCVTLIHRVRLCNDDLGWEHGDDVVEHLGNRFVTQRAQQLARAF